MSTHTETAVEDFEQPTCVGCLREMERDASQPAERWVARETLAGEICDDCARHIDARNLDEDGLELVELELLEEGQTSGYVEWTCPECGYDEDSPVSIGVQWVQCHCGTLSQIHVVELV